MGGCRVFRVSVHHHRVSTVEAMLRQRIDRQRYPDRAKLEIARQLRQNPTPTERHVWELLRRRGMLGLKFRRQHVLHGFIVDFYCARHRIVLELDGASHDSRVRSDYDASRTRVLTAFGYRVIRLPNRTVSRDSLEALLHPFVPPLPKGRGGQGERHIVPPLPKGRGGQGERYITK